MASLVENAIRIKEAFDDILSAIKSKGVTPSDESDVSTYSSAVDLIVPQMTPSSVRNLGYLYWYGGYAYANTSIVDYTPSTFSCTPNVFSRSADNKSVSVLQSGRYFLGSCIKDQGTGNANNSTALILRRNGDNLVGGTIGKTNNIFMQTPIVVSLNVGDVLTMHIQRLSATPRKYVAGAVTLIRLGDL